MEDSQTRKTTTYPKEFCRAAELMQSFFGMQGMKKNIRESETQNLVLSIS